MENDIVNKHKENLYNLYVIKLNSKMEILFLM